MRLIKKIVNKNKKCNIKIFTYFKKKIYNSKFNKINKSIKIELIKN